MNWDWNWLLPALQRYLSAHAGREVRADDLKVKLGLSLEPIITVRGLYVSNAPWADTRQPMAQAKEVSFTFLLRSLLDEQQVVSRIVLTDARVDMERQADGLRNWSLLNPDYRGPPKVKVLSLEAYRTQLRIADRSSDFDIRFTASSAATAPDIVPEGSAPTTQITARGTYRGAPFAAQTLTSGVITFRETGKFFSVRGYMQEGDTRFDFDGQVADLLARPLLHARLQLGGPTLSQIPPFILQRAALSRPYHLDARVDKSADEYHFTEVRGKIGDSDISGDAVYTTSKGHPYWRANLKSNIANLFDLRSIVGVDYPGLATNGQESPGALGQSDRLFSPRPFNAERLRLYEAVVELDVKALRTAELPALDSLRLSINLHDGILQAQEVDLGVAGGVASGQLTLDARQSPSYVRALMQLKHIRLGRLFPLMAERARYAGALNGRIDLQGSGESIAQIMGGASGKLGVELDGGSVSKLADAELSLSLGKIAGSIFSRHQDIPIACALANIDLHDGKGTSNSLLFESAQTRVEGAGTFDLRDEQLDIQLVARPKQPGLLTLGSRINIRGSFKHPQFALRPGTGPTSIPQINLNTSCPSPQVAVRR